MYEASVWLYWCGILHGCLKRKKRRRIGVDGRLGGRSHRLDYKGRGARALMVCSGSGLFRAYSWKQTHKTHKKCSCVLVFACVFALIDFFLAQTYREGGLCVKAWPFSKQGVNTVLRYFLFFLHWTKNKNRSKMHTSRSKSDNTYKKKRRKTGRPSLIQLDLSYLIHNLDNTFTGNSTNT